MEMFLKAKKAIALLLGFITLSVGQICLADTVIIQPNTVISVSKTYNDVTLDMRQGYFTVINGATLTIRNSKVLGVLSKDIPALFNVVSGTLNFRNNDFSVQALNIAPHSDSQSLYYVMQVSAGKVDLRRNTFKIDKPFAAGLLISLTSFGTNGFNIVNNTIEGFHGALYLINSNNAVVNNNTLIKNTYGNIVSMGNNIAITNNKIYFSGNNRIGNSIDVINSENIKVNGNLLMTPSCHAIYIVGSRNVKIDKNRIVGGITYGVYAISYPEVGDKYAYLGNIIPNFNAKDVLTSDITITNNFMSQNRFGVAASDVRNLTVNNNFFVQRFDTAEHRKFWTDNKTLLVRVTGLNWNDNLYKEAYTQEINGDNSKSNKFVIFPVTGGITL